MSGYKARPERLENMFLHKVRLENQKISGNY